MPLFFAIAGYLFYNTIKKRNILDLIKNKLCRLIIPYFFVALFWMIPIKYSLNYYEGKTMYEILVKGILFGKDNGHLWYLPTLFFIFIVSGICVTFIRKTKYEKYDWMIMVLVAFIISLATNAVKNVPFASSICSYWIWFSLGYTIYVLEQKVNKKKFSKYKIGGVFTLLVFIALKIILNTRFIYYISTLMVVVALFYLIPSKRSKIMDFLARNSFGLYLFHSPLIYITVYKCYNWNPVINVVINFFVFGLISLVVTILLGKER